MKNFLKIFIEKRLIIFLILWFIINVIQSFQTELLHDETYYWLWSRDLAWGYFDHPPMVAIFIKIGYFFFENELGVRLVSVVTSLFYVILFYKFLKKNTEEINFKLFVSLFGVFIFLQIYGFVITPDTPLFLFTLIFLLVYKKILEKPSIYLAFLWGVIMAAMFYSKYMAVLPILFVLFSNFKNLLTKPYFWIASFVGFSLFFPHLFWLYETNFETLKFHLFDRKSSNYQFYFSSYFINSFVALGLLSFPLVIMALKKHKPSNKFEKALFYITIGSFIFYFYQSFKVKIQAQWFIITIFPLAYFTYHFLNQNKRLLRFWYPISFSLLVLTLFGRIIYMFDFMPLKLEVHNNLERINWISSKVKNHPVIFENSYIYPSRYSFETGQKSIGYNTLLYRKSQFSSWDNQLESDSIFYFSDTILNSNNVYHFYKEKEILNLLPKGFKNYSKLRISAKKAIQKNDSLFDLEVKINNPYPFDIKLNEKHWNKDFAIYFYFKREKNRDNYIRNSLPLGFEAIPKNSFINTTLSFKTDRSISFLLDKKFKLGMENGLLKASFHSDSFYLNDLIDKKN